MKFSIITISYNPGLLLKETIDSVLSQDHPDIEYIVIDGGSTDGTVDMIKSYDGGISKYISEPDTGLYDALNKGIGLATGDVVGFVHADDLFADSSVLSSVVRIMNESGSDAVYGDLVYVAKDNPQRVIRYWRSGDFWPSRLKYGWMPPHPAMFVKRDVYEKARLANGEYFDTSFTCAADYDLMMRLLKKWNISVAYLPVVLVKMRVGGISNKSLKNMLRKSREDLIAMRRNNIGGFATLIAKNFRKLPQFYKKRITAKT